MKKHKTRLSAENLRYLKILGIICTAILFYAIITNLDPFFSFVSFVSSVFSPLIIGLCIAFIINIPLRFFELKVFGKLTRRNGKKWSKLKRPVCLIISFVIIISILVVLLSFIIPQFISTLKHFVDAIPYYMAHATEWIQDLNEQFNLSISFENIENWLTEMVASLDFSHAFDIAMGIFGGAVDLLLGIIFSIYILSSKEALGRLAKGILYSTMSKRRAKKIISIATMSNKAFTGFVAGQCVEVAVIGVLCFVGMLTLGMADHALLVSCIVAITAFIPIFGPIVGSIMGAIIILIVDPWKALWFLVFIIVLQQLESHILYPKIMGHHVSLPGILVLTAVTIGGGLFGVPGIIISVPMCSVVYTLFSQWMKQRLKEKKIYKGDGSASTDNSIAASTADCDFDTVSDDDEEPAEEIAQESTDTTNE